MRQRLEFIPVLVLLMSAPTSAQVAATSLVVPRGGGVPIERQVESVSEAGVVVVDGGKTSLIGLDKVKEVRGEGASKFQPLAELSERLWRARVRLERSDVAGAEGLLESVAPGYALMEGPTAAVVHVGLMRCRIERGAYAAAITPWLYAVAAGDSVDHASSILRSDRQDAILIDRDTGLAPSLAPIFIDLPSTRALVKSDWPHLGERKDGSKDVERALALSAWYHAAASCEVDRICEAPPTLGTSDRGMLLVRDIVLSRIGDESVRASSRNALKIKGQESQSAWIKVWATVAIGRSLLREADEESRLLGVSVLLEVPSIQAGVLPELTGIALIEASDALSELGDQSGAERLRAELRDLLPDHGGIETKRNEVQSGGSSTAVPGSDR